MFQGDVRHVLRKQCEYKYIEYLSVPYELHPRGKIDSVQLSAWIS